MCLFVCVCVCVQVGEGCHPDKRKKHIQMHAEWGPRENRAFQTKLRKVWGILKMVSPEAENQLQDDDVLWFQP